MSYVTPTLSQLSILADAAIQGQKCCDRCKDGGTNCSSCGAYEVDD
jgi:hypothetical protein